MRRHRWAITPTSVPTRATISGRRALPINTPWAGKIGHRFGENLWINATLRQFATAGTPNPSKGSFVYGEGLQYTGYSVGAAYSVSPKISVTADYANFFGTRKNVYSGPTLGLGLSVQLN